MLTSLQNEYDAIVLETFTLKKHYDNVRQELAHALYANDASARVIARLLTERDQAREALANIQGTIGAGPSVTQPVQDVDMDAPANGTSTDNVRNATLAVIETTAQRLSSQRRAQSKRKAPEGYASSTSIAEFAETKSLPSMHNAKPAGVTCLTLSANGAILVTGGNDKNVQVYDREADKVLATLRGHSKKITGIAVAGVTNASIGPDAAESELPSCIVSASEDNSIKIWTPSNATGSRAQAYALTHTIDTHKAEVTGVDLHPSNEYIGSASRDGVWTLHSVSDGSQVLAVEAPVDGQAEEAKGGYVYESFAFHPDGQIAATGTAEGAVRIWDIKASQNIHTLQTNLGGKVSSLHFSENGYFLAVGSDQSKTVEVYDLRKLSLHGTITVDDGNKGGVSAVRFDPSLQFLAVATDSVHVYANKSWNHLSTMKGTKHITDLQWDRRSGEIVVSSSDRTVRTFGMPS